MDIINETCFTFQPVSITINPVVLPTIALASSAENACLDFCVNDNPTTTLNYSGTTGNPVTYSIVWDASPENDLPPVTDEALPSSPITIDLTALSGRVEPGIYTGTLTVKNANGTVSSPGSVFSVNVNYVPKIRTSGIINAVETSTSSQNASLPFDDTFGSPISYAIDWDAAANAALLVDQPSTPFTWSSFGGIIDTIVIPANVPAGTYSGTITSVNETCSSSKDVVITINPAEELPTIDLATSTENVCLSGSGEEDSTSISFNGTTGDPISYSIVWDSSPENSFETVTDAPLPASPITIAAPGDTSMGTYTGTLTVKDANGISSLGKTFTVNVGFTPIIGTSGVIAPVTTSDNIQNTTLSYFIITDNTVSYYIDWDQTANDALLEDQPITMYEFIQLRSNIGTIEISANAQPGSYSGTLYFSNTFCTGSHSVSLVINEASSAKGTQPKDNVKTATTDLKSAENKISVGINNKVINVEAPNQVINEVFVFDVSGNLLYKKNKVSDSKLAINNLRSSNQVLVVKVILDDNSTVIKKVIY